MGRIIRIVAAAWNKVKSSASRKPKTRPGHYMAIDGGKKEADARRRMEKAIKAKLGTGKK